MKSKYINATCTHRFLAFLVDNLLVTAVTNIILRFIPVYREQSKVFSDLYMQFLKNDMVDVVFFQEFFKTAFVVMGINLMVVLPLIFLYYVVLAYFWDKQTIGRLLVGLKVVTYREEEKPTFSRFLLREVIGGYLCLNVLGNAFIVYIITWILSANSGRSLVDYIGGTRLVYSRVKVQDSENTSWSNEKEDSDYIEAEFKETSEKASEQEDEEYKVF